MAYTYSSRIKGLTTRALVKKHQLDELDGSAILMQTINKLFPTVNDMIPEKLVQQLTDAANHGYNEYQCRGEYAVMLQYAKSVAYELKQNLLMLMHDLRDMQGVDVRTDMDDEIISMRESGRSYELRLKHISTDETTIELIVTYWCDGLAKLLENQGFHVTSLDRYNSGYLIKWDVDWYDVYQQVKDMQ